MPMMTFSLLARMPQTRRGEPSKSWRKKVLPRVTRKCKICV